MSIRWKIFIPIFFTLVAYIFILIIMISTTVTRDVMEQNTEFAKVFVDGIYNEAQALNNSIETESAFQRRDVERRLREILETAHGMLESLYARESSGAFTREQAQTLAVEQINSMLFGVDGYIWADTVDYINVALPPNPSVVGTSRRDLQDQTGTYIIRDLVDNSVRDGEAWLEYYFPKPGETEASEKLGYTLLFEPWGWVLGTGEYIDVIEKQAQEFKQESIDYLNNTLYTDSERTDYPFILDSQGRFVTYVDQSLVGTSPELRDSETGELLLPRFINAPEGRISYFFPKPGMPDSSFEKTGFIRRLDALGWTIVYSFYPDDVLADVMGFRIFLIATSAIGLAVLTLIILVTLSFIQKRISLLTKMSSTIALGDLDVHISETSGKDELAQLNNAFAKMVSALQKKSHDLESVADGNLISEIVITSDKDVLGLSMKSMQKSLTGIIASISDRCNQAQLQSSQVAQANGTLSQSIVHQAASLEQISASLNEIDNQANLNAGRSKEASEIAGTATSSTEKAAGAMDSLTSAMEEITASSGDISGVVKLIDDIAFQINLLALNANVEAARAGKYGKGFAVVADEVRNLANRSAEAVKETQRMVEESIKKVDSGNAALKETSGHLTSIETEIGNILEQLKYISESSVQQALSIKEITGAMNQIEDMSQQNSASAEQTSAAAEEMMKAITDIMNLLDFFETNNGEQAPQRTLPPPRGTH